MFNTDIEEKKLAAPPVQTANWQTRILKSTVLDDSIKSLGKTEQHQNSIRLAINEFIGLKSKKLKSLQIQKQIVMPNNLYLDTSDRGKFKSPGLRTFDHYHLKVRNDPRKGDTTLVYKQVIDQDNHILNLNLTAVCTHADYDKSGFAKTVNNAEYSFLAMLEEHLRK